MFCSLPISDIRLKWDGEDNTNQTGEGERNPPILARHVAGIVENRREYGALEENITHHQQHHSCFQMRRCFA
ncbi:hypothetical protein Pyn_39655 [Prunus yedoensis var. nudiflora]|uniref:Uncharacterized protein n=1 Tax=Prunus yedoensis var. nudiflora TaxID=2094558 RepID=A0A314YKQ3_PRUYE|nr:hypothetical protein Pyn_39655 [Prunus yedoensis var. nudiflora]